LYTDQETIMSTPTVRLSKAAHRLLREMAEQSGETMLEILDKALDAYRRRMFFEKLDAGYAALRADPKVWASVEEERKAWEATLMDGLDPGERWEEGGRCIVPKKKH
jgi:hypothetical protein